MLVDLEFSQLTRTERTVVTNCMSKLLGSEDMSWKVTPHGYRGALGLTVRLHAESLERARQELSEGWGRRLAALTDATAVEEDSAALWAELKRYFEVTADTWNNLEMKLKAVNETYRW